MTIRSNKTELSGTVSVPGSKSHTIRAGIFSLLASGTSVIRNPLESDDCLSCMDAISAFGAEVRIEPGVWTVTAPPAGIRVPAKVVDVGNSGSVLYFITPVAATLPGWTVLTGDASICTRPVRPLLEGLRSLGAEAFTTRDDSDAPPAVVRGPLKAGTVELEGNLSQYASGIMMAASRVAGTTVISLRNPKEVPFLQMTCTWLESLGVSVRYDKQRMNRFEITGPVAIPSFERRIPSDWEGVAFPLVAAVITGSSVTITGIDCSGSQGDAAIVDNLVEMGADIVIDEEKEELLVNSRGAKPLSGATFNCAGYPDAVPSLAVAACFARGVTRLEDIGVCRLKETDRITLMKKELETLGAVVHEGPDWMEIHGNAGEGMHGGIVDSHDDHRIAMALAVAGLAIPGDGVFVRDAECCAISFPEFYTVMNGIHAGFVCTDE